MSLFLAACMATLGLASTSTARAQPDQAPTPAPARAAARPDPSTVAPDQRDRVLPADWRRSADLAWTTSGDPTGFHLLVAESKTGYTWRTAATLWEPGFETDRWVGNACLTGSSRRAVVVYAPRQFTNRPELFDRGAFAAVVDLSSGKVTKLRLGVSLAYHNPGCGTGEAAVLVQSGDDDLGRTRLHWLDASSGRLRWQVEVRGQATSAVPVTQRIVAALSPGLVALDRSGTRTPLVRTRGTPYDVHPDARGGVSFLEQHGGLGVARRLSGGRVAELARGPLTKVGMTAGGGGRVFVSGAPSAVGPLPSMISRVDAPVRADVSTLGRVVLQQVAPRPGERAAGAELAVEPGRPSPLRLRARILATRQSYQFSITPGLRSGRLATGGRESAAPLGGLGTQAVGSPTDPVDADRTCAVPRNDPRSQVYQPHWTQVEWAADLAVQGALTVQRPNNWKQSGLPAWSPQGMFPSRPLDGGGSVPAQVLLGILAQESNLWQASPHAVEGVTGNPLVGNFYGLAWSGIDPWRIDWSKADCGYGVAQVTDGMRLAATTRTATQKRAIALDYATNIAAGLQILQQKWNQTRQAEITVNDGSPEWLENWFAAVWAYNSGINPQASTGNTSGCTPSPSCTDASGNWGLGYSNNPANADYPRNRTPFLEAGYEDAKHPQQWPYPEKVIGWAAYPIIKYDRDSGDVSAGYAQAWWLTGADRMTAKPPVDLFCTTADHCDIDRPGEACSLTNFHCWWHWPVRWKDCGSQARECGNQTTSYQPGDPEPAGQDAVNYPPNCGLGGMPTVLVIDDVPDSVPPVRESCGHPWTNAGSFGLRFTADSNGMYRSKIDFHQIGGGFGGHFWFAHTRTQWGDGGRMAVTGTWTLTAPLDQWARVMVHMPDHGAHTQQAAYTVDLGNGVRKTRVLLQRTQAHEWVSLGAFRFAGIPSVSLSNVTKDGTAVEDVAWDAIAFQPLPGKPRNQIVALGDSFSSGEGAVTDLATGGDYYRETDDDGDRDPDYRNGCHRSRYAWSRKAVMGDNLAEPIGHRADRWDDGMDYHLVACSGAETENLLPDDGNTHNQFGDFGAGQYRELSQVDRGFLDENTTLVTVSVGGNDARFGPVLEHCMLAEILEDCQNTTFPGDAAPLDAVQRNLITGEVKESIKIALRQIHRLAPNATIVLMGYPLLFDGSPLGMCLLLTTDEVDWIHDMGDLMSIHMALAAADLSADEHIPVYAADPRPFFAGHGACGQPPAINQLVPWKTEGDDPDRPVSQQSVHPNLYGTTLYANALNDILRQIGI